MAMSTNENDPMKTVAVQVAGYCPECGNRNNTYATPNHPITPGSHGDPVFATVQCENSGCRELVRLSGNY